MRERRRSRWRLAVAALFTMAALASAPQLLHAATACTTYAATGRSAIVAGLQRNQQSTSLCATNPSSTSCKNALAAETATWKWAQWNNGMYTCCTGGANTATCNTLASNPAPDPHDPVTTAQPGPALPN
jgi:hypothetical protein